MPQTEDSLVVAVIEGYAVAVCTADADGFRCLPSFCVGDRQ